MEPITDIIRRIHTDGGFSLDVQPDPDTDGDFVQIITVDKKSQDWFGKIALTMPPELAKQVGRALISCADEIKYILDANN